MTQESLASRDDLTRRVVTSTSDFDVEALAGLMREAWAVDYTDRLRINFNKAHLQHMMTGRSWFGILVCTRDARPVGFEIAMQRTLFCQGQTLRAFLVTAFTVSAQHRRRGIGRWLLEGVNQEAFERRKADLLFSSFHHGAAGSPTVQSTFDQIQGFGVNRFHTFPSWGRRIDKQPLPSLDAPISVVRLEQVEGSPDWQPRMEASTDAPVAVPSRAEFTDIVRKKYAVAFAPDASFSDYFLHAGSNEAGTLWYDFGQAATCFVSYALVPLIVNERCLRPVGVVQAVHAQNCEKPHLEQILVHLAHRFLADGCFAISLYDVGVFPHEVLEKLGLQADDKFDYAVRGPRAVIDQFNGLELPLFLDFN